jgi:NIMA-interacting peptidyl-prolyl cis-trans isomerase 4
MGKKGAAAQPAASIPKPAQSVNVSHILCARHGKALEALARLDAGEPFASVARECSEDKARQGGALGWKTKADLVGEFAEAAFSLAAGERSKSPVKTPFGYHIILVTDRQ